MQIKNIIFDFGGVLVDWNPRHFYKNIFDNELEMEFFLKNICNDEWNQHQDKGRSFAEGIEILVKQFPDYETNIKLYFNNWESMLNGEIVENARILKLLKGKYRLFGLTNWSAETFPVALKKFSFFNEFEAIVVSGQEKMIKPDKEIFYLILNRYKLKAEESVFIDDNFDNIITAKEIGFHSIHLNNNNLEKELIKRNIL